MRAGGVEEDEVEDMFLAWYPCVERGVGRG